MQGSAYILLFFSLPARGAAGGRAGEQLGAQGQGVLLGAAPRRKYAQRKCFLSSQFTGGGRGERRGGPLPGEVAAPRRKRACAIFLFVRSAHYAKYFLKVFTPV